MVCCRNFSGGYIVLPDLGVKLNFKPTDIMFFFCSRLSEHFVTNFEAERSSLVFFTDEKNVLQQAREDSVKGGYRR